LFVLPAVLPRASKLAVAGRGTLAPAEGRAKYMPVRTLPAVDGRDGRDGRAGAMRAPAIVDIFGDGVMSAPMFGCLKFRNEFFHRIFGA
jgi:hypothetical protein